MLHRIPLICFGGWDAMSSCPCPPKQGQLAYAHLLPCPSFCNTNRWNWHGSTATRCVMRYKRLQGVRFALSRATTSSDNSCSERASWARTVKGSLAL